MRTHSVRIAFVVFAAVAIALGLASRRFGDALPWIVATYAGDTLWAFVVYAIAGAIAPAATPVRRAAYALAFAVAIECSQLYHAPWIDALRDTTPGALVLGHGFLWSDLVCYAVGVALGCAIEITALRPKRRGSALPR